MNCRQLIGVLAVLALSTSSVTAESLQSSPVRESLSQWQEWVSHQDLTRLRVTLKGTNPKKRSRFELKICRRDDQWHVLWSGESDKHQMHDVVENLYTDQHLHLQSAEPINEPLTFRRGSGQLKRRDVGAVPTALSICGAQICFGFLRTDVQQSIPELCLASDKVRLTTKNGQRILEVATDHGPYWVTFNDDVGPLPIHLAHHRTTASGEVDVIEVEELRWDYDIQPPLPTSYRIGNMSVSLADANLGVKLHDSEFQIVSDLADGTRVIASDVPVDCEWRNGRIVALVGGLADGTRRRFFTRPKLGWLAAFSVAGAILGGALFIVHRRS